MKQELKRSIEINKKNKANVGADDPVRPIPKRSTQRGITLVALVITIIVLLILAMVSIKIAIDEGLTTKASDATKQHTIASEEEEIQTVYAAYQIELAKGENVTNPAIEGATVTPKGEDWNIIFTKTNNEYELKKDGTVKLIKEGNDSTTDSTESAYITPRTEVTYKGKTLKVGDYVNYDEGTGYTWTTDASKGTGLYENLISKTYTTENMDWRVLGLDKNGNLELIADKQTSSEAALYLKGKEGYYNGEEQLNEMCNALYGKGGKAQSARSVNVEDIDAILGYNKKGFKYEEIQDENNWAKLTYGCKTTYKSTTSIGDWFRINGSNVFERVDDEEYIPFINIDGTQATDEKTITIESNAYSYEKSEFENRVSSSILEMVFEIKSVGCYSNKNSRFWLASRYVNGYAYGASWDLLQIDGDNLSFTGSLYSSYDDGMLHYDSASVRPVVTLKSDVELTGSSNDGWTIE